MTTTELPRDPATPLRAPLMWEQTSDRTWRTVDGAYLIAALNSPDQDTHDGMDLTVYQLRGTEVGTSFGYHIQDAYDLRQAMTNAVRHRYCQENAGAMSVPENYDADQAERFFWPISQGTTKGALVLTHDDEGRRVAAIIGMSRGEPDADGECRFEPYTHTSIVID